MRTWMEQSCGSQEQCKPHLVGVRDSYQVRRAHPSLPRPARASWVSMPEQSWPPRSALLCGVPLSEQLSQHYSGVSRPDLACKDSLQACNCGVAVGMTNPCCAR